MRRGDKKIFATNKKLEGELISIATAGFSISYLANYFNCEPSSIRARLKKLGFLRPKKEFTIAPLIKRVVKDVTKDIPNIPKDKNNKSYKDFLLDGK